MLSACTASQKAAEAKKKFMPKWIGPFKITQLAGPVTAKLELPPQWKIHPVFHVSLLKSNLMVLYNHRYHWIVLTEILSIG